MKIWKSDRHAAGRQTEAPPNFTEERDRLFDSKQEGFEPGNVLPCNQTGLWYFTMPLLDGARSVTDACEGLTASQVLHLLRRTLDAIASVHTEGILHRDLKPDNLLVVNQRGESRVYVIDFGLAKLASASSPKHPATIPGPEGFGGMPEYAAPELLHQGKGTASYRTEVVSAGIIAHEMLTGRSLYCPPPDRTIKARLEAANSFWTRETHPRASDLLTVPWSTATNAYRKPNDRGFDHLKAALERILNPILRCATHEEPDRRYDSVPAFKADLERATDWIAALHARPDRPPPLQHLTCFKKLPTHTDPFIRRAYVERVANDAALLHGSNALVDRFDFTRARRLLGLVSRAGRATFEFGYTHARAHPALFEYNGEDV